MARKPSIPKDPNEHVDEERTPVDGKAPTDAVKKDLPVEEDGKHDAKFGEPIADAYPEGQEGEIVSAANKPAETTVEHPLAPTDTNPNPHGTRTEQTYTSVPTKDKDGNVEFNHADEGDGKGVQIEGTSDHPEGVHLGDGRVLSKGERMTVNKDLLKDENLKGKFKRV